MARWRGVVLGLLLAAGAGAAQAADPVTLFVLRMLRDQAITSAIEAGVGAARPAPKLAPLPLLPADESQRLRQLIDESFVHLGPSQREELFASLARMLSDPRNAPMRAEMIGVFTAQAVAMRDAHRQLARLTGADMRLIAADARMEFARLPPDERRQMLEALKHGVPGMPPALARMMMAEFETVR